MGGRGPDQTLPGEAMRLAVKSVRHARGSHWLDRALSLPLSASHLGLTDWPLKHLRGRIRPLNTKSFDL